jgi:dihydroorotase-like cyclic amidohydrolase
MRNAKSGALLTFFAEVERRENEQKAQSASNAPWDRPSARPIQLDLIALARTLRKAPA